MHPGSEQGWGSGQEDQACYRVQVWGGPSGRVLNVGESLAERLSEIRVLQPQIAPNLEARSSDTLTTKTKDCRVQKLESLRPFSFLPQRSRNLWRDKGDAKLGRELDQVPEGRSAASCRSLWAPSSRASGFFFSRFGVGDTEGGNRKNKH